jgi:hypothetical protein
MTFRTLAYGTLATAVVMCLAIAALAAMAPI